MTSKSLPRVALLWAQFAQYHVDRCEAVARHLDGQAQVLAIEVATTSQTYAWPPSGELTCAQKITLFPDRILETIPFWQKLWAEFRVLRKCRTVCCGIGYNEPEIVFLSWLLKIWGVRLILMTDSKFDDRPRQLWFEAFKASLLSAFPAAIVAGNRQASYLRFLGFRRRPIMLGYDCVSVERIRAEAAPDLLPDGAAFADRPFIFVGRFVEKKNLTRLIDAYAGYVNLAGPASRRLVLVGSGPLKADLQTQIAAHGIGQLVDFTGFLDATAVSRQLSQSLALLLVSTEEQWGLVVNEAVAVGLPVIVSSVTGAGDLLVRNLVNGFVVEAESTDSIQMALLKMAADRDAWLRMSEESRKMSAQGDVARFAEAVEFMMKS